MEELLARYSSKHFSYSRGDVVKGTVVEKSANKLILDIGGKSEGVVAEKAFKEAEGYIKTLSVGDEVEAQVIVPETPDGYVILSLRKASSQALWKRIEEAKENLKPIMVEGKSVTNAGLMVDVAGLSGFLPKSQIGKENSKDLQALVGKRFEVLVIDVDRESNRVILSEKEISEKEELDLVRRAIKDIKIGEIFDGVVTTIYDFGCFVKITAKLGKKESADLEGLVHISEMSWEKLDKPDEKVLVGDKVKVKVIGKEGGKLALSIKQTLKDPWDIVEEKYKADTRVKGKVTKLSDFGVFVALESGVEGLIHMTKIPPNKRLKKGDEIEVYVESVDKAAKKISLGLVLTEKPVGYK